MVFHIITLFPSAFRSYLGESILKRAIEDGKIKVQFYNPREYAENKWRRIDRAPYGGGPGMVIQALPVIEAVASCKLKDKKKKPLIIWLTPGGKQFDTKIAKTYAKKFTDIIFICGRYEGIDARVKQAVKNAFKIKVDEVSVGPYVVTGGELPAMVMVDSISRQIPGVLGDLASLEENRVASPDVYTRPEIFKFKGKNYRVPKILLSGHHQKIENWRKNLHR
ncbi:tRNA (guanosine(37)-N1)-methyltransferase TrmD [Patescibacteria group bacterium]|nr:tRNA (guanosine(37)-N1)-methyltransferase TrmD [Patescibacteria group bacterium]